mmetsp:Transcript_27181/g.12675  ORF Transcript_27181/g.12675 Transcript_27181/m.12675 type:complete len:91 (-) Transcript_27181:682-954(-)
MSGFQQVISDREMVLADLEKIVLTSSSGLVFIDERLLSDKVSRRIEVIGKQWEGAIVILPEPGKEGNGPGRGDFGMQLIARVLGYQMKLS